MRPYVSLRRAADFSRLRRQGRRIAGPTLTIFRDEARRGRLAAILDESLAGRDPMRLLIVAQPSAAQASFPILREQLVAGLV